jgi:glutathione S-transferase
MKLYFSPGACSLATRISLHEAGISAEFERVDIRAKITAHGDDYSAINPKGSVPLLVLDDGQAVTENVAIMDLLAEREPKLGVDGPLGRTRLIEMLSFLSTELHIAFKPFFHGADILGEAKARDDVTRCLDLLDDRVRDGFLFGANFTVADAYLFVMLRWAMSFDVPMQSEMFAYFERVAMRQSVRQALAEEGLTVPLPQAERAPA